MKHWLASATHEVDTAETCSVVARATPVYLAAAQDQRRLPAFDPYFVPAACSTSSPPPTAPSLWKCGELERWRCWRAGWMVGHAVLSRRDGVRNVRPCNANRRPEPKHNQTGTKPNEPYLADRGMVAGGPLQGAALLLAAGSDSTAKTLIQFKLTYCSCNSHALHSQKRCHSITTEASY